MKPNRHESTTSTRSPWTETELEARLRNEWPDFLLDEEADSRSKERCNSLLDSAQAQKWAQAAVRDSRVLVPRLLTGGVVALLLLALGLSLYIFIFKGETAARWTTPDTENLAHRTLMPRSVPSVKTPQLNKTQLFNTMDDTTEVKWPTVSMVVVSPVYAGYVARKNLTLLEQTSPTDSVPESQDNSVEQNPAPPLTARYGEIIIKDVMDSNPITSYVMDYCVTPVFFDE